MACGAYSTLGEPCPVLFFYWGAAYPWGMVEQAVLVASGEDRAGIMDELSQFLLECGGNITDSRSCNLRGQFALLLLVRGEATAIAAIRDGLPRFAERGINVELKPVDGSAARESVSFPYVFIATGKDQAGVLHRISHLLRALNVNIENLRTSVGPGGEFEIRLELAVGRETPVVMLRDYLAYLCKELGISGRLNQA